MLIAQLSDPHFVPEDVRLFGRLDTRGVPRAIERPLVARRRLTNPPDGPAFRGQIALGTSTTGRRRTL
jgi:hypothetical protein